MTKLRTAYTTRYILGGELRYHLQWWIDQPVDWTADDYPVHIRELISIFGSCLLDPSRHIEQISPTYDIDS
jgi:hypothetical protein